MPDPFHDTAILYRNAERTITLLDLPKSIENAQELSGFPSIEQYRLCSSEPPEVPYPSTEPKSDRAKAKVRQTNSLYDMDDRPATATTALNQALSEIAAHYHAEWCLSRITSSIIPGRDRNPYYCRSSTSMAASAVFRTSNKTPDVTIPREMLESQKVTELLLLRPQSPNPARADCEICDIANTLVHNKSSQMLYLHCQSAIFHIPPKASFMLSRISDATVSAFSMAALALYPNITDTAGRGQFDFILLDPPWQNRSIKRSAQYPMMAHSELMAVLSGQLEQHIAPGGVVACWVTNSKSTQDVAMQAFDSWGIQLIGEWVWLKTTVHGVPVTEIKGLWRKPYELLLMGKKVDKNSSQPCRTVHRSVIVAVPDRHSRKPSVKELIEPMLPMDYRALEVFARNLTAGWSSWGDEVLKFSWEGHWRKPEQISNDD